MSCIDFCLSHIHIDYTSDWIEKTCGIAMVMIALYGVFIARRGLGTWQCEFRRKREYELARRLLVSTLNYDFVINAARYNFVDDSELANITHYYKTGQEDTCSKYHGCREEIEKRIRKIQDISSDIQADMIEAKEAWENGQELADIYLSLFEKEKRLILGLYLFLLVTDPKNTDEERSNISFKYKICKDVFIRDMENENDIFGSEIEDCVDKARRYLTPLIAKNQSKPVACIVPRRALSFFKAIWPKRGKRENPST